MTATAETDAALGPAPSRLRGHESSRLALGIVTTAAAALRLAWLAATRRVCGV